MVILLDDNWIWVFVLFAICVRSPVLGTVNIWVRPGSFIKVEAFVEVLTNYYSLDLGVFLQSRFFLSVLLFQRLRAQILAREVRFHRWFVMVINGIKTNTLKQETKCLHQTNGKYKIRQILTKIMNYLCTH